MGYSTKIFAKKVNEKFSLALYLIMGWFGDFHYPTDHQPNKSNLLGFDADGWPVLYSWSWILRQKEPYFHMIWHLFILAASALQYIAIVYVM